ncbi:MAG: hypothetical protein KDJ88_01220 [Bauldia sp.]|nr:hypothetical protein [Bauldia sp.]
MAAEPTRKRPEFHKVEERLQKTVQEHEQNFHSWMTARGYFSEEDAPEQIPALGDPLGNS